MLWEREEVCVCKCDERKREREALRTEKDAEE